MKTLRLACWIACTMVASAVSAQTSDGSSSSSTDDSTGSSTSPSDATSPSSTSTTTSTTTSDGSSTSGSSSSLSSSVSSSPPSHTTSTTTTTTSHGTTTGTGTTGTTSTTGTGTTGVGTAAQPPPPEHEEGDGRDVDFIWLEVFGGIANVNLVAFQNSNFADVASGSASVFNEVNATGPMIGGALGFRIYWLAVGARTTFASYNTFQIGTVGGEVALRFPIPVVEPYIRAGFGYAWMGDANYSISTAGVSTMPATTVYGWAFNSAIGADIFLANWITIGGGVGFDVLNMTRQSDPRAPCMGVTDFCPMRNGDAVGYQVTGFGQIGIHI